MSKAHAFRSLHGKQAIKKEHGASLDFSLKPEANFNARGDE